jgi:hypothetical protein
MGHRIERVLIVGPLAVFADGFTAELERLGYSPFTAVVQLRPDGAPQPLDGGTRI